MNRLFLLLFGMVTFVAHAQVPDYVPTDGLVAWYPFNGNGMNEVNTEDEFNVIGPINTLDRFGIPANAYYFDGIDDEIIASNPGVSGSEISLSFWYQSAQVDYSAYLIAFGGPAWGTYFEVINNHWSAQTPGPCYGPALSGGGTLVSRGTEWMQDSLVWHHCAIILPEGALSLNDVLFYFDGSMLTSVCSFANYGAPEPNISISEIILFGSGLQDQGNWSSHFEGSMDDIGIWNRALTEEEVLALYNADPPITGCTDPTACNFDAEAMSDDGSCIPSGCMEPLACNYNALAECEGEACDYACCPGPGCCADGTSWDYDLGQCVPAGSDGANDATTNSCPQDLDFDGVVGVGDLMDLLSVFGTDCPTNFTCGDPINYHGYDYATVQIGEQCWFAENLRTELYRNGDSLLVELSQSEWVETDQGACAVHGEGDEFCHDEMGNGFDPCDPAYNLNLNGILYNGPAVLDERKLCPSDWHISSAEEWDELELFIVDLGFYPTQTALPLKSAEGWCYCLGVDPGYGVDTIDQLGFSATAGGQRNVGTGPYGGYNFNGFIGFWWTPSNSGEFGDYRKIEDGAGHVKSGVTTSPSHNNIGRSIRCLKDQ